MRSELATLPGSNAAAGRRTSDVFVYAAVFLLAFAFRWLTISDFTNDHFDHLSAAQQLLLGDLPVRDFVDEGFPLAYIVSALGWRLLSNPFLSEAVIVVTALALSATISFGLVRRVTGSVSVATAATAMQLLLFPRTYSYPKLLVYAIAIAVAWWAVERLSAHRVAALAAATAFAYYFRHDHGIYVGLAATAMLVVACWQSGMNVMLRTVAMYAAFCFVAVLPHLVYVQWATGLPTYFALAREYVRAEKTITPYSVPAVHIDTAALWSRPALPPVYVRWKPEVTDEQREEGQREYGLVPVNRTDLSTWKYEVLAPAGVSATVLRRDPRVDDTHGFGQLEAESTWSAWMRDLRLGRGWRLRENSVAVLFWTWWLAPLAAGFLTLRRLAARTADPNEVARMTMLIALAWCVTFGFLRAPLAVRLADPAVPQTILGAWVVATLWRWPAGWWRVAGRRVAIVAAIAVVSGAVVISGDSVGQIRRTGVFAGPGAVAARWQEVDASLADQMPGPVPSNPSKALLPFLAYQQRCTAANDRLYYAGYSPEVFIVARRGFAGDSRELVAPFHSTPWEQQRTLARIERQQVPFVVVPERQRARFALTYSQLWRYFEEHYVAVATVPLAGTGGFEILRRREWTPPAGAPEDCRSEFGARPPLIAQGAV